MPTARLVRFAPRAFRTAAILALLFPPLKASAQSCTSAPAEAVDLHLIGSNPTQLFWGPPADPGGTQTVAYDVLRSPAPDGFLSAFCLASGVTAIGVGDALTPPHIFYYLVRAKN